VLTANILSFPSEAVVALDGWKALLSNGQAGDLQTLRTGLLVGSKNGSTGATSVRFTVTPRAEGWVNLSFPAAVLTDLAGNGNVASNEVRGTRKEYAFILCLAEYTLLLTGNSNAKENVTVVAKAEGVSVPSTWGAD
jgi:hypothetical protein